MELKVKSFIEIDGKIIAITENGEVYEINTLFPISFSFGELESNPNDLITIENTKRYQNKQ